MRITHSILVSALLSSTMMVSGAYGAAGDEARYSACMTLAEQSPDRGINDALVWKGEGGGVPARHCEAVGLFHMGEYAEAAARMMTIAADMRIGRDMPVKDGKRLVADAGMLADMYDQAANAWLLAGETVRAEDAVSIAVSLVDGAGGQELDYRVDRARVFAADRDFTRALEDLRYVRDRDPARKDILLFIASAARGIGQYAEADAALKAYLATYPNDTTGLLELGNLAHARGDKPKARQAWLKVLQLADEGPDADAARANLEKLDVTVE